MVVEKRRSLNEFPSDLVDRLKKDISENMDGYCAVIDIGDNGRAYLEKGSKNSSRDNYALILHEIKGERKALRIVLPKGKDEHSLLDYRVCNWMIQHRVTPDHVKYDGVCKEGAVMYELIRK